MIKHHQMHSFQLIRLLKIIKINTSITMNLLISHLIRNQKLMKLVGCYKYFYPNQYSFNPTFTRRLSNWRVPCPFDLSSIKNWSTLQEKLKDEYALVENGRYHL